MKQLSTMTKPDPSTRIQEAQELIKKFGVNEDAKDIFKRWNIEISREPFKVVGTKFEAGHYVMGMRENSKERVHVKCEGQRDIEQKIQQPMYIQPEVKKWVIFYENRDVEEYNKFTHNLQQALKTFQYKMEPPKSVLIQGNQ
jgi:hypothetical protein